MKDIKRKRPVYFSKHLNRDSAAASSYISGKCSLYVRSFLQAVFLICIFEDMDISNVATGEHFCVGFLTYGPVPSSV